MVIYMPRVADREERRRTISHAFQQLLAEDGAADTTFVRIAGRAGISVGLIQHYFANKEELLRFAYEDCLARRDDRVLHHIVEGEATGRPIAAMLLAALHELLPLDAERSMETSVVQSLLTEALHDETLADVARRAAADAHTRVATAVSNGKRCGEVRSGVDADAAASLILSTTHGLAASLALSTEVRADADRAEQALRTVIGLTFTGRCHHDDHTRR